MNSRIIKLRKSRNWTQDTFAEKMGISKNYVSLIENGKKVPSSRLISDICQEFDINKEWLLYGKEPMVKMANPDDRYSHNLAKLANMDDETIMNWVNIIAETNPAMLKEIESFMKKLLGIEE